MLARIAMLLSVTQTTQTQPELHDILFSGRTGVELLSRSMRDSHSCKGDDDTDEIIGRWDEVKSSGNLRLRGLHEMMV